MEENNYVGKAKQSGWDHHYRSLSAIKDECNKFGTLARQGGPASIEYLKAYLNHVFCFAQQIMCFYEQDLEDSLTEEYLKLVKNVNVYIEDVQEGFANKEIIPEELVTNVIKYFNKLMRLAKNAGLLIDQDDSSKKEPTKGAIGLR